ncbi:MAG: AAA family ATPase [Halanaerobiales bacterium]
MENISKEKVDQYQQQISEIKKEISKVIVGMDRVIENVLLALLSNGHVLMEGLPGLGKTMLVRTLGKVLDLNYSRIQFTPDLMPADIIGTNILMEENGKRYFDFQEGPLFAQIVLADEINRATPKTQSALLEAMQEKNITVAGKTRELIQPFIVLATQNPIEMEGTYPLPEAQIDRFFFKVKVNYPEFNELKEILKRTTGEKTPEASSIINTTEVLELQEMVKNIPVSNEVMEYAIKIVTATRPQRENVIDEVKNYVNYGASPRGAQALILAGKARAFVRGRYNVSFADIRKAVHPALRHRVLMNFEGEASGFNIDVLLDKIINNIPETE